MNYSHLNRSLSILVKYHIYFCLILNEAVGANKKHRTSKNKKDKVRPNNGSNKENNPKVLEYRRGFSY